MPQIVPQSLWPRLRFLNSSFFESLTSSGLFVCITNEKLKSVKAVYYTVLVHNFNLQEKTTSTVEVTTNFVKKFKAHFEKKLLY